MQGPELLDTHAAAHASRPNLVAIDARTCGTLSVRRATLDGVDDSASSLAELGQQLQQQGNDVRCIDDGSHTLDASSRVRDGTRHAQLLAADQAAGRWLLTWFTDTTPRALVVRRALLTLRIPPSLVAALARASANERGLRFSSDYAYWYGVRRNMHAAAWKRVARGTPILLYHAFGTDVASRFVTAPRSLSLQLQLLARLGYRTITLEALADAVRSGTPPPSRTIVLTADDGYADNEALVRALARNGFRASIFLVSSRLGGTAEWNTDPALRARALVSADEARGLQRDVVEVGAHTRSHASLPDLPDEAVEDEIAGSKQELEAVLGSPVTSFAYPYGRHDERSVAAVERAGFTAACTVAGRLARLSDDPLLLPRIEIEASDSLLGFLRKVWFGAGDGSGRPD